MSIIQCITACVKVGWQYIIRSLLLLGVGVSLPDNIFLGFIANNSAVIFDSESDQKQELHCHSALQSGCTGEWLGLTPPSSESCDDNNGGSGVGMSYKSIKLDLGSLSEEGVYTCAIQDEAMQEQRLYIGVYQSGEYLHNWSLSNRMYHCYNSIVVM